MKIRPKLRILDDETIKTILADAYEILGTAGVKIPGYTPALDLLEDGGVRVDREKEIARFNPDIIDRALSTVPASIDFYDQDREKKLFSFEEDNCYICCGATGINIQDYEHPGHRRQTVTRDQIINGRLIDLCENISFSAPFNLYDVPREIADNYRLLVNYLYTSKPVFASVWSKEGFDTMIEMRSVMAGGEENARTRYAHILPNNPSSPLHWSPVVIQNFMDSMRADIPPIIISIPIAGASCPATIAGTVVQNTAENLAGVVIGQLAKKGGALIWGGGPTALDFRTGSAPQSAIESLLMMCMLAEVGKHLNIPVGANIGRTDSKLPDAQGGLETSMGYTLGCLVGVNMMRGAGILEYATTMSHEKLLIDNEIAGQALRMVNWGIEFSEATRAVDLIKEIASRDKDQSFLGLKHTTQHFRKEFLFPSEVIDRGTRTEFEAGGFKSAVDRAHERIKKLLEGKKPREVGPEKKKALFEIVKSRAKKYGMDRLPIEDLGG